MISVNDAALDAIVWGKHGAPYDVLGPHVGEHGLVVRAFQPAAQRLMITLAGTDEPREMIRIRPEGLFEFAQPEAVDVAGYQLTAVSAEGHEWVYDDAYAFRQPLLTDDDRYLLGQGRYLYSYQKMGAHLREINGVAGVNFVVWAPNAARVSVVGDFNAWDARIHPMQFLGTSGLWELFIPGLEAGMIYKYDLISQHEGYQTLKADPYAFSGQVRPDNASVVVDFNYDWQDTAWQAGRAERNVLAEPMTIYEVHLGSWRRHEDGTFLSYREVAEQLIPYVQDLGYTHIELMPVMEHPLDESWGYQVTGYFAATSRYGSPQDLMYLIDRCHQAGIGVILDWVPAHFPKDGFALSYFDGTHLYSHEDAVRREHPQWGTYIFNYGRNEVRNFLISSALFWLDVYHADGLRVDAVSSMLYLNFGRDEGAQKLLNKYGGLENLEAIEFMYELNTAVHGEFPGTCTIAEEASSWPKVSRPVFDGGLGFTFKWDMGWMHDTLDYMKCDPLYRKQEHNHMTFAMMYAYTENFVLPFSHDEVVHMKGAMLNKMPGDWWQKFANLRLLFGYQWSHPGKKLTFMGMEIGHWQEWNESAHLDWALLEEPMHQGMMAWVRDMGRLYHEMPAFWRYDTEPRGFAWINPDDAENSVLSYIRYGAEADDFIIAVGNFTPVPRFDYRIGVPEAGAYEEVLNSDAECYGGGNVGNWGGVETEDQPANGYAQSLRLTLPPLGMLFLRWVGNER